MLSKLTEEFEFAQGQPLPLVVHHLSKVRTMRAETQDGPKPRSESQSLAALRANPVCVSFQCKSAKRALLVFFLLLSCLLRSRRELCVTTPESDGLLCLN